MDNYEFTAMLFGTMGAFATSKAAIEKDTLSAKRYWGIGANAFIISNSLLFVVASKLGLSAMAIQMVLLSAASIWQLYTHVSWILSAISIIVVMIVARLYYSVFFEAFRIGFDLYPAILAIIASFLWGIKSNHTVLAGFILFILADLLYLIVAITNDLPWFFLQTCAYLSFALIALNRIRQESKAVVP